MYLAKKNDRNMVKSNACNNISLNIDYPYEATKE